MKSRTTPAGDLLLAGVFFFFFVVDPGRIQGRGVPLGFKAGLRRRTRWPGSSNSSISLCWPRGLAAAAVVEATSPSVAVDDDFPPRSFFFRWPSGETHVSRTSSGRRRPPRGAGGRLIDVLIGDRGRSCS